MEFDNKLDPSTITDVETAKLALRWAVEKIHTISDDNTRLKEDNRNKTLLARTLTQQSEQKDEVLKKWQTTIKTWEENWKTQTALEADLKGKLREQIINEEAVNWRQARAQLENEIKILKEELGAKEGEIGRLKILTIEEIRKAAEVKEAEAQAVIRARQDALSEQENIMRTRYELLEKELLEKQRVRHEQTELALNERYEIKMRDVIRLHETKEKQLEEFRKQLEDEYIKKSEELSASRSAQLEQDRLDLAARREKVVSEAERAAALRLAALEQDMDKQRAALRTELEAKERHQAEVKEQEIAFLKTVHQKELAEIRDRLRQYTQQREKDYVNLRMQLEDQMLALVRKHDDASAASYAEAVKQAREKWNRLSLENRAKLDALVNQTNAKWEKEWEAREAAFSVQAEERIKEEKESAAALFRKKEEALRKELFNEQSDLAAKTAAELEKAKAAYELSYAERLELAKKNLEEAYVSREKALEERFLGREKALGETLASKEETLVIEKEQALAKEKEALRQEAAAHKTALKERFTQYEDELKLKYAHKEIELADKLNKDNASREAELERKMAAELEKMAGYLEEQKKTLARREEEIEEALAESRKKVEADQAELEKRLAERNRELLAREEKLLSEKFARREAELAREHSDALELLAVERADFEKALAEKEASVAEVKIIARQEFEKQLKEEKTKLEESNRGREAGLKAREHELSVIKNSLEQQYSELKVKLYQELQGKEQEQFSHLARAKEEMYKSLNNHRAVMDKEYEERFEELRRREDELETRCETRLAERLEAIKKQKEEDLEKMNLAFESKKMEMERQYQAKEHEQYAAFSEKLTRIEAEATRREKDRAAAEEKNLAKRRDDMEILLRQRETELEKKYIKLSADIRENFDKERSYWETQKLDALNQERQTMRAEFEKKEAFLAQKLDEERLKNRQQRVLLEEDFAAKKTELEKSYYSEVEKSRIGLDKMRQDLEEKLKLKFRELEAEKTRLTMFIAQKEEEYVTQYQRKEEELLKYWESKQQELKIKYEKSSQNGK